MSDHRMQPGNHKADKPERAADTSQDSLPRTEPAEPVTQHRNSLDEIPANEGGKADLP